MKQLFGLCAGLALMLSTIGCRYYPGYFDPSTGLVQGGYWTPDYMTPLNPFCWLGGCGYWNGGYGYGGPASGYGAPVLSGPTYVQPGFAPSYGRSGCSDCTSSPIYSPGELVVPPGASPTPAVPASPPTGVPGSPTGSATWVIPTPIPAAATAPLQTTGRPTWIPARY